MWTWMNHFLSIFLQFDVVSVGTWFHRLKLRIYPLRFNKLISNRLDNFVNNVSCFVSQFTVISVSDSIISVTRFFGLIFSRLVSIMNVQLRRLRECFESGNCSIQPTIVNMVSSLVNFHTIQI